MNNKGYVTVFVTLMIVVMLVITVAVMKITDESGAKTKAVSAVSSAMSSEKANYNRFIFDRYHILLLDKNASGSGEGAMEQGIEACLKIDLGEGFSVNSVELSGTKGILDNTCDEFKLQIKDNFKYQVVEYTVDNILKKTNGEDEPIDNETINEIDSDVNSAEIEQDDGAEGNDEAGDEEDSSLEITVEDPRDELKTYVLFGIPALILPDDAPLSSNIVKDAELPSAGRPKNFIDEIKTEFDDLDRMEIDSVKGHGWTTNLVTNAEAVMYSAECFNCLTDQKYDDTYLNLEMEYIVGGDETDAKNYKKVVNEILLIRFGFNLAYILNDSQKMKKCETLATFLTIEFPGAKEPVKYLLAGCWSYIESIADVYRLLRNHKVPFVKSSETWVTDFHSLSNLESLEGEASDDETGLDYKEYLMILIALQGNDMYYRMLDLMQMNVTQPELEGGDTTFRMKNAITAFGVNADIGYGSKEFNIHEETGY